MNKVMLAGRITKPVELKSLPSGSKVAVGSIATHDFRGGEEYTEFHRLVFWEKLAEIAAGLVLAGELSLGAATKVDKVTRKNEWVDAHERLGRNR